MGPAVKNLVAVELRRLHRKALQGDTRTALVDIAGKVKPGSQDMVNRTVVLILGQGRDGTAVESPPVRWQATGTGAFKMHAVPGDNEQMKLHSPSGTVGSNSMAHWGTFDQDNPPPSQSKDETVLQYGTDAKVVFGKTSVKLSWGDDVYVELSDKTAIVRVPDGGTVKLGKEAESGEVFPVKLVTGEADSVKAKMG